MPITRIFNSKNHTDKKIIEKVEYIADPHKTKGLVFSHGIRNTKPAEDIIATQRLYHKTTGRRFIHFVVAYKNSPTLKEHIAHTIGQKIISVCLDEYQVFMGTHSNTAHIHNHFLVSTVNCVTGKKWQMSKSDLQKFKDSILDVVQSYGEEVSLITNQFDDNNFDDDDLEWEFSEMDYDTEQEFTQNENSGHYVTSFFGTEYISVTDEIEEKERLLYEQYSAKIQLYLKTGDSAYIDDIPIDSLGLMIAEEEAYLETLEVDPELDYDI